MARGGATGEKMASKKAAGQSRKAEQADKKKAAGAAIVAAAEDEDWKKGEKKVSAKASAASAKAEAAKLAAAAKKALLEAEEAALPSKKNVKPSSGSKKSGGSGVATPSRKLNLDMLDSTADDSDGRAKKQAALTASNIDDALDALFITSKSDAASKLDRHPERRFKAAYAVFEERRLAEMATEKGLRRQQKIDLIRKEFEKHPDNPFNQAHATFNSTQDEIHQLKKGVDATIEARLART